MQRYNNNLINIDVKLNTLINLLNLQDTNVNYEIMKYLHEKIFFEDEDLVNKFLTFSYFDIYSSFIVKSGIFFKKELYKSFKDQKLTKIELERNNTPLTVNSG